MPEAKDNIKNLQQNSNLRQTNPELYFFWKIAGKWWFFPLLYLALAALFVLISFFREGSHGEFRNFWSLFALALFFMPNGILYLLPGFQNMFRGSGEYLVFAFPIAFHIFWIASVIILQYFKMKRNKIIKWLIITIILLMVVSFAGCVNGARNGLVNGF